MVLQLLLLLNPWLIVEFSQLTFSYRYYFVRCSSELADLVPLLYSCERSTHDSDMILDHDLSVIIHRCYKDVYVNSIFPRSARFSTNRMLYFELGCKWLLSLDLKNLICKFFLCMLLIFFCFCLTPRLAVQLRVE